MVRTQRARCAASCVAHQTAGKSRAGEPADRDGALRGECGPALRQPRYRLRFTQGPEALRPRLATGLPFGASGWSIRQIARRRL